MDRTRTIALRIVTVLCASGVAIGFIRLDSQPDAWQVVGLVVVAVLTAVLVALQLRWTAVARRRERDGRD